MVREGDIAPGFALPDKPRHEVDVGALIGAKPVVLLFFPLAFSSVCTAELCRFRDEWSRYESTGASVFGISVDSPFVNAKFREIERVPFPILSDFNKSVSSMYGVLHEDLMGLKGVSKRAAFVIGADGRVRYRWVTEDPGVQVDFGAIWAALDQ